MNKAAIWVKAIRAPFLTGAAIPVLFGTALAYYESGIFNGLSFVVTLIGMVSAQAAANLSNDYFDHRTTDDDVNQNYTPFSGGSRIIQDKILPARAILIGAFVCWGISLASGIYLTMITPGYWILLLAAAGFLGGFFYTASRYALAYNRLGELAILLNFGILPIMGAYYVQTGCFSWSAFWGSFPIGFLITAILYINQYPDYQADKSVGKNHLVVAFGRNGARIGYYFLMFGSYIAIILLVVTGHLTPYALVALLSLPIALRAVVVFTRNFEKIKEIIPAQAGTIQTHLLVGILMSIGCVAGALLKG